MPAVPLAQGEYTVGPTSFLYIYVSIVQKQVHLAPNALDCCQGADAVVIATEWREFREIDWEAVYASMNKPAFVFDGRLLVDAGKLRKIGFKVSLFYSIPRADCVDHLAGDRHRSWGSAVGT